MTKQTFTFTWNEIDIEAKYDPKAWGGATAHLAIQSVNPKNAPLPITDTGYRSHYHPVGTIEKNYDGDVIAAVTEMLDEAAKSKDWQKYLLDSLQGDLFA